MKKAMTLGACLLLLLSGCSNAVEQPSQETDNSPSPVDTPASQLQDSSPDWYPEGMSFLRLPTETRSRRAELLVNVKDLEYTKCFVCRGKGEIRVWDEVDGKEKEPESWPCNGTAVESVTFLDAPGERVIIVDPTHPEESDWNLVAMNVLPEGFSASE